MPLGIPLSLLANIVVLQAGEFSSPVSLNLWNTTFTIDRLERGEFDLDEWRATDINTTSESPVAISSSRIQSADALNLAISVAACHINLARPLRRVLLGQSGCECVVS